jgi:hypothetical protein
MKYTETQAVTILKAPKNKEKITKGRYYEQELRLYTEAQNIDELKDDEAFQKLCATISKRLPSKAYSRVLDFIEYPLAAVELTTGLLMELYKVFHAKNVYFTHEIDTEQKNKQLKDIIKELDVHTYLIEQGKKCLKNRPNTIVVIDKDDNGRPYIVNVDSERLIDADPKPDGTMTYIAFRHSDVEGFPKKKRIAFYDEEAYTVYIHDEEAQTYVLESTVEHNIGYCPARCFFKDALNTKNPFKRHTPIALTIGEIREWQLFNTYKYYTEHYAAFPVIEKIKPACTNELCVGGLVPQTNSVFFADNERRELPKVACQECSKKEDIGVGTVINLKKPNNKDEFNSAGVFRFIAPEITGVEYLATKLEKLEKYIELKTVGQNNLITSEAVNEKQVQGSFQSKESVLMALKETFEDIYIWIVQTAAKAYFLGDVQIVVYANFGSEFYLVSENELQARYEKAKTIGLPEAEVSAIYDQLVTTKYKDNPDSISRMEMLKYLDPAPFANFQEVEDMKAAGVMTEEEYIIKRRFMKFIERFELEQANVINFGKNLSLSERIKLIFNILKKYSNEYNTNQAEPIGEGESDIKED